MRLSIGWVALALISALVPAANAEWSGKEVTENGALHVRNPETPVTTARVDLEQLWMRGDEDDDILFGRLSQLAQDAEGNLYVLDSQLTEIQVFSPTGKHLRTVGRQGEGPGEFMSVSDMFIAPNGLIGLVRIFPGRVYQIGTDGSPADYFNLPQTDGFQLLFVGRANANRIVLAGAVQSGSATAQIQTDYLKAYDVDGKELVEFVSENQETQFGGMKFKEQTWNNFARRWALADDGRVAVAMDFDAYKIDVYNADGTLDRVIERPDHTTLARTDEQLKRFQTMYDALTRWSPGSEFAISKTHSAIARVWYRPDGNLWVLSNRGSYARAEGLFASIDEYDRQGRFVRQLDFVVDGDPVEDGIFFMGDRMYRVTDLFSSFMAALGGEDEYENAEELDPLRLVAYRIGDNALGMK